MRIDKDWVGISILITGAMLLSVYAYISNKEDAKELKEYGEYTIGTIFDYGTDAKGHMNIWYHYPVYDTEYTGLAYGRPFPNCEHDHSCHGKKFLVKYSAKNRKNDKIYFDKPIEGDTIPAIYKNI